MTRSTRNRPRTGTSSFGVADRTSHDASAFYARLEPARQSSASTVNRPAATNTLYQADNRSMPFLADDSVAAYVFSPPYFAGKDYELDTALPWVPESYDEYLDDISSVLAEVARTLEPGGRVAINVPGGIGRKPWLNVSGDVSRLLAAAGFLLRGEVVWDKSPAGRQSSAWGTFQSARNPVMRDSTERVLIASWERLDRAGTPDDRQAAGLPYRDTISKDGFIEATLDIWRIAPESAKRVGHPAPFPTALARRAIEFLTYEGDLIVDPYIGSGTTALAAHESGRSWVGVDVDASYLQLAADRLRDAGAEVTVELDEDLPAVS